MSSTVNIEVKNLEIEFPLLDAISKSLRNKIIPGVAVPAARSFKAINGMNFEVSSGQGVGLLGINGAGKSTLLRALAGVYKPTKGTIDTSGSITTLFDIALGMDQDASGYENIPLLMAARSIPMNHLKEVVADAENFSELGDALFRPVRTYSAGMRLRLAFAVATFMSSDILLLDEVIGVGDASFRQKSQQRLEKLMRKSGILFLASHSNAYLKTYCDRGFVLEKGEIIFDGPIDGSIKFLEEHKKK